MVLLTSIPLWRPPSAAMMLPAAAAAHGSPPSHMAEDASGSSGSEERPLHALRAARSRTPDDPSPWAPGSTCGFRVGRNDTHDIGARLQRQRPAV